MTSSAKLRQTMVAPPTRGTGESRWCPRCGEPLPDSSRTCPRCQLAGDQDTSPADSTAPTTAFPLADADQATGGSRTRAPLTSTPSVPAEASEAATYDDPSEAVTMASSDGPRSQSGTRSGSHLNVGDEFGTRYRITR